MSAVLQETWLFIKEHVPLDAPADLLALSEVFETQLDPDPLGALFGLASFVYLFYQTKLSPYLLQDA